VPDCPSPTLAVWLCVFADDEVLYGFWGQREGALAGDRERERESTPAAGG
jgi:hypothetical protein